MFNSYLRIDVFLQINGISVEVADNAIVVNQFQSLGRVVPFGVSNIEASFRVLSTGCNGRFPASAHEQKRFNHGDSVAHVYPLSKFIDDDQRVLLMKVDTEGNERNSTCEQCN